MVVTDQGWLIRTALTTLTGPRSTGPAVGGEGGGAVQDLSRARPSRQTDAPLGGGGRHSARTGAGVAGGSRGRRRGRGGGGVGGGGGRRYEGGVVVSIGVDDTGLT